MLLFKKILIFALVISSANEHSYANSLRTNIPDETFVNTSHVSLGIARSLQSSYPANADQVSGSDGFLIGSPNYDSTGHAISSAGDFNGDGVSDLITSAPYASSASGRVWMIFGKSTGFSSSIDPTALSGTDGFILNGVNNNDQAGYALAGGKDVNGDGFSDIVIGAPYANSNGGRAYVVFGSAGPFSSSFGLSFLNGNNGFSITGGTSYLGASVGIEDINGDGFADVLVAGSAGAWVIFGKSSSFTSTVSVSALTGSNGFYMTGGAGGTVFNSIASIGDFNGDGYRDFGIGVPSYNSNLGQAYIFFGKSSGFTASSSLSSLSSSGGMVLNGVSTGDYTGNTIVGGDVNGDGFSEIAIGAVGTSSNAGAVYVLNGNSTFVSGSTFNLNTLDGKNGFIIVGANNGDKAGYSLGMGDINNDGLSEIFIGAPFLYNCCQDGKFYAVFGNYQRFPVQLGLANLDTRGRVFGINRCGNSFIGMSISGVGDINGDGSQDFAIGATGSSQEYCGPRKPYSVVIFGIPSPSPSASVSPPPPSATRTSSVTPSKSVSNTPSQTPTSSITPSQTPSISLTSTQTPTSSITPSQTPSISLTSTTSITPSFSPVLMQLQSTTDPCAGNTMKTDCPGAIAVGVTFGAIGAIAAIITTIVAIQSHRRQMAIDRMTRR